MARGTTHRVVTRALATSGVLLTAIVGMVLMSGSGQPVTAQPYPRWQQLQDPPLTERTDALAVHVHARVLVLGGRHAGTALRDGAAYDLRTGAWHSLGLPVGFTSDDEAVAAAGEVVVRHRLADGSATWWVFDPRPGTWRRMDHVPTPASAPFAFRSEVYAISGRHVVVYSVALHRWTALAADPLRPRLVGGQVTASRAGTVVTGQVGSSAVADRWDGTTWRRAHVVPGPQVARPTLPTQVTGPLAASVRLGGRWLVVSGGQAWIHTP